MENILEQKKGFGRRKFTLTDDRIIIETKESQKSIKFEVKLDQIGYDIYYQSESSGAAKFLICFCAFLLFIFWGSFFFDDNRNLLGTIIFTILILFVMFLPFLIKRKDDVYLTGGEQNLVFYRTVPNEEHVLSYVNAIIVASKQYLRKKYARVDIYVPEEVFLHRLSWLLEKEIISREEIEELKSDYRTKKLLS